MEKVRKFNGTGREMMGLQKLLVADRRVQKEYTVTPRLNTDLPSAVFNTLSKNI